MTTLNSNILEALEQLDIRAFGNPEDTVTLSVERLLTLLDMVYSLGEQEGYCTGFHEAEEE